MSMSSSFEKRMSMRRNVTRGVDDISNPFGKFKDERSFEEGER